MRVAEFISLLFTQNGFCLALSGTCTTNARVYVERRPLDVFVFACVRTSERARGRLVLTIVGLVDGGLSKLVGGERLPPPLQVGLGLKPLAYTL